MNYKVYQGDELKQTVTSKTAVMNGLQPNKTYVFGVYPDNGQTGTVGANLIVQSDLKNGWLDTSGNLNSNSTDFNSDNYIATNGETVFTFSSPDYTFKGNSDDRIIMYDSNKNYLGYQPLTSATQTLSISNVAYIRFSINSVDEGNTTGSASDWLANHRYKLEKGSVATTYVATTSVTTRGIRFNIPKTLTVGSTITLRYEEYPLGIVPIGNEPSGYFGGGNKQNLSAKVISTANGSSVVEVSGNVIEVGGRNLLQGTGTASGDVANGGGNQIKGAFNGYDAVKTNSAWTGRFINLQSALGRTNAKAGDWYTISIYVKADKQIDTSSLDVYRAIGNDRGLNLYTIWMKTKPITTQWQQYSWSFQIDDNSLEKQDTRVEYNSDTGDNWIYWAGWMLEPGTIATPYAAFVDGDTFTAQPDGTCALFSEYKALYY